MNNNTTMTRDNNGADKTYACLLNHGQTQDYTLYKHIRARFLQQSALYLGIDLSDSKALSLCFSDNVIHK